MKKLTGINRNDNIQDITIAEKSFQENDQKKPTIRPKIKPKFQETLNKLKFFFDFSTLSIFCHLLNKLRQFGQKNPIVNPNETLQKIKNPGSGKIIWAPVKIGVATEEKIRAVLIPKNFLVTICPIIGEIMYVSAPAEEINPKVL
jgi:hypothetical protein